jgi:hypothetical protein
MNPARVRIGIQGQGSSTVDDMRILGEMLAEEGIFIQACLQQEEWPRLEMLRDGQLDFVYESASLPSRFEGRRPEDVVRGRGALPIRIVASAHSGSFGYVVRGDSPLRTIYDIGPDTRVAVVDGNMGDRIFSLLAWRELNDGPIQEEPREGSWKVKLVPCASWEENLRAVPEGRADVAGVTPQNPIIKQAAAAPGGIRFLELPADRDPAGARRYRRFSPQTTITPAPEEGAREIWGVKTVTGIANLWCLPDFDEELAWRLTRWFDLNYPRFKDLGNKLKTYSLECLRQAVDTALAPVHGGTVRYLKEKGLWQPEHEARQAFNLRQEAAYLDAWADARARAAARNVPVSLENPDWRRLWEQVRVKYGLLPHLPRSDAEIREQSGVMG